MAIGEDPRDVSTASDQATMGEVTLPPPQSTLHLQFLDLALDPLPNLTVRVSSGAQDKIYTTNDDGQTDGIQARAGIRLRIAVQRFDGSYKEIENAQMPAGDATWNYISPQLVLETKTELHEGDPGQIASSIPQATLADEGDREHLNATEPLSTGAASAELHNTQQVTSVASPAAYKPTSTSVPARTVTPKAATSSQQSSQPKPIKQATISGGDTAPARQSAQTTGRTERGTPMAVLSTRIKDWWNSWTLPSINLWGNHGNNSSGESVGAASVSTSAGHASKVQYSANMLPKVQALIQFAQEQTTYVYDKGEGTAAVIAQMVRKQFKHEKGEKRSKESLGRCYQYVRIALTRAGIVDGFVADTASASTQASASLAGQPLLDKGFVDVTDEVPDPRWAATGDVIVYSWSETTWAQRKKEKGLNTPNHGHIDIRSETSYISDFIPSSMHPKWYAADSKSITGYAANYVNIRIYRKYYDPRPTCRIRAFLACLREYETQAVKSDSDRYRVLNTALPSTPNSRSFSSFATHPWSKFPKSSWAKGTSTASGAYQCTLETAEGFIKQRMLFDLEGHDLFTPAAQDRLAVMLMEEKGALPAVRKGDLDTAVQALLGTWASLPGATQNHGRKTADGKPLDMSYLREIYANFLRNEIGKYGIVE